MKRDFFSISHVFDAGQKSIRLAMGLVLWRLCAGVHVDGYAIWWNRWHASAYSNEWCVFDVCLHASFLRVQVRWSRGAEMMSGGCMGDV